MKSAKVNFGSHPALFWLWLPHYRALLLASTFKNITLTSKILMKSTKANFASHQAIFWTLAQHYRALLLRERELRSSTGSGQGNWGSLHKEAVFLHFWLSPMNKIAAQSLEKATDSIQMQKA